MSIIVKPIKATKKEIKKYVQCGIDLYKGNDCYVPPLVFDEVDSLLPDKNPAFDFCRAQSFMAYRDNKPVGRITAIINDIVNERTGEKTMRFGWVDFIDDNEVVDALFHAAEEWGRNQGMTSIVGPMGFSDMDHEGMLVEGFDEFNMSITFYNFPYYETHYEKLGLVKDVDWVEYYLTVPSEHDKRIAKLSSYLKERNGFELVTYKTVKQLKKDAFKAFKVIDEAFSVLYGTVPLTDEVINKTLADNIPLMNLKYICSVKDKHGDLIGFAVLVPSIAKALKKSNGKLLPFGIFRMPKALKGKGNDTLEMFFIAVKPEYQSKGVPAIIMDHVLKVLIENGIKYCETGPELELNADVQGMWKGFDARKHKRRRCYKKGI